MKNVLAFGEVLWDMFPDHSVLGGASYNFAYRMHALGYNSRIISAIGRDELGEKLFAAIEKTGVDTSLLQWDNAHPTGEVKIYLDEHKNPDYLIVPEVAYDYVKMNDAIRLAASTADCVCFSTLTQRNEISRATMREIVDTTTAKIRFYDINLRKLCYSTETITWSLERADIIKLNETECLELASILSLPAKPLDSFCNALFKKYPVKICVVTLGPKGALAMSSKGEKIYDPGFAVKLVDPCGSGDAFSAAFVHSLLQGKNLKDACSLGNIMGAIVAEQDGTTRPITDALIKQFCQTHTNRIVEENLNF